MKTFLFELTNPSEILKKYLEDVPYAFIPVDITKVDEGEQAIFYWTKEDLAKNEGSLSFIDGLTSDNVFEYTVKII